jgi:hypothetical protein
MKQPWHSEAYVTLAHAWAHLIMYHTPVDQEAVSILIEAAYQIREEAKR